MSESTSHYRSYNSWLRERFGERVHKVVVDAGFTCPNRDGSLASGGCTYCNNGSFRPPLAIRTNAIREQVASGIAYLRKRVEARKFIVYFQPFSNTYADVGDLDSLYSEALDHPDVVGLAIGTRPDCIDPEKVALIDRLGQSRLVCLEFGVESIYDRTLRRVNRAHTYKSFIDAMAMCRGLSFSIGAHIILGFPWETRDEWLAMAGEMSHQGVGLLKIHHLHLVRGTPLAREHEAEPFTLLDFAQYRDLVCDFVERLGPSIVIERLFGEAPLGMLVAPNWGLTRNEVIRGIQQRMDELGTVQGARWNGHRAIAVAPTVL